MSDEPLCRFKISLRFHHPAEDLSAATVEFDLAPLRQWTVGEQRLSPKGTPLEGRWKASYWTANLHTRADEELEAALLRIGVWLDEHAAFIARHLASGGWAGLFIGVFLQSSNAGFALGPTLLARYAAIGFALEFDLYGPDDPSDTR